MYQAHNFICLGSQVGEVVPPREIRCEDHSMVSVAIGHSNLFVVDLVGCLVFNFTSCKTQMHTL